MCQVYGPSYRVLCDMCGNSMRNTDDICPHCKHNFAAVSNNTPKVTHHLNCPFPIYPCECKGNTRNPALSFEQSAAAERSATR
jgi:hypothetical protein